MRDVDEARAELIKGEMDVDGIDRCEERGSGSEEGDKAGSLPEEEAELGQFGEQGGGEGGDWGGVGWDSVAFEGDRDELIKR
jgi:hypothetical protein